MRTLHAAIAAAALLALAAPAHAIDLGMGGLNVKVPLRTI